MARILRKKNYDASAVKSGLDFEKRLSSILALYGIGSLVGYWLLAPFISNILI